jgi:hypothetical protein
LELHHASHAQIYMGTNHVPFLLPSIITGLLILCGGYLVVPRYGVMGLIMVQAISHLLINNWYPVYLNLKLLDWKLDKYFYDLFIITPIQIIKGIKISLKTY